ncbi:hypothetical protein HK101_011762 [Irineochytrium annulatum]|nr:hypothetical protein HK101_011762 [Irineochytrium annulatum]
MDSNIVEDRILHLESLTIPDERTTSIRLPANTSVIGSFQTLQAKFRLILDDRRALSDFLQKYSVLRELIQNTSDELEQGALDPSSKKEIVLASEEEVVYMIDQLKELETLKDEVDATVFKDMDMRIREFSGCELTQIDQMKRFAEIKRRFDGLASQYNTYDKEAQADGGADA